MVAWLILAVVVLIFACVMAGLWREAVRPLTETDEFCSRMDAELDRERVGL